MQGDAGIVLLDPTHSWSVTIASAPSRASAAGEDHVQAAAMDADLRKRVAGVLAAVLAVDELAEPVEKAALADRDAGADKFVLDAEGGEFPHRMGQQGDADPEFADFRRPLEDPAAHSVPWRLMASERPAIPPPMIAMSIAHCHSAVSSGKSMRALRRDPIKWRSAAL